MNKTFSLYLDLWRGLAAVAIALWVGPAIDRTKSQYYQGLKPLLPPQVRPFA